MTQPFAYVRQELVPDAPPPANTTGIIGWLRTNLFDGPVNSALTLIALYLIYFTAWPIIQFALVNGVWIGEDRAVCTTEVQGGIRDADWFGACWAYVDAYFGQFMYGRYPIELRWRVNVTGVLFFIGLVGILVPTLPFKRESLIYASVIFPIAAVILLTGGHFELGSFLGLGPIVGAGGALAFAIDYLILTAAAAGLAAAIARGTGSSMRTAAVGVVGFLAVLGAIFALFAVDFGLEPVETALWGGLLVTLVIAFTGIAVSLPIGVALALGRRSEMPVVRVASVIFIEFWRGVPLITVLFMSSVMLPLFLPEGTDFDKLLRALIGVALFSAAYMAEVVRGGLQAIPSGQYEGAMALGLTYWQMMGKIILPQALKLVIPGIVNTFIGLFKDTTLVLIIGLFDFLGQIQSSYANPHWASPVQSLTGYLFAALVFWVFTFSMSRYSIYTERRLHTGHKR